MEPPLQFAFAKREYCGKRFCKLCKVPARWFFGGRRLPSLMQASHLPEEHRHVPCHPIFVQMIFISWAVIGTLGGLLICTARRQFSVKTVISNVILGAAGAAAGTIFSLENGYRMPFEPHNLTVEIWSSQLFGSFLILAIGDIYRRNAGRY